MLLRLGKIRNQRIKGWKCRKTDGFVSGGKCDVEFSLTEKKQQG